MAPWPRGALAHVAPRGQGAMPATWRTRSDVQLMTGADPLAHRLGHRIDAPTHCPQMTHLGVSWRLGHRDVDAVLVNIQTYEQSARFPHGPSPRKFATTRPPRGPVHWCSSARPRRATYVVAGGGPPEFTKPSCLGTTNSQLMPAAKPLVEAEDLSLGDWLKLVTTPVHKRSVRVADYSFPTDAHRDQFLGAINTYSEQVIRDVLRSFLMDSGTLGTDEFSRRYALSRPTEELEDLTARFDFYRRLIEPPFLPWQGNTWVLDLLPHYPSKALDALGAYFVAHCQFLPDGRLHGLADAEAIIRSRYLHRENSREALLALKPDEFEHLIGALYEKLGYAVTVTQRSRDGGVDVEAKRTDAGGRAVVLVQCKRYEDVVRVQAIRELMGVVSRRQANKGVIVATCGFTPPARQEAEATPMIELIDFTQLNRLLNQHLGATWPDHMSYEIRRMQIVSIKAAAGGA